MPTKTTISRSIAMACLCAVVGACAFPVGNEPVLDAAAPVAEPPVEDLVLDAEQVAFLNEPIADPSRELIRSVQQELTDKGFHPGPADGAMGAKTLGAMRLFKVARRLPVNNDLSRAVVIELGLQEQLLQ